MKRILIFLCALFLMFGVVGSASGMNIITNGSFEQGFAGWGTVDLSFPLWPLAVRSGGNSGVFFGWDITPTDGEKAASHGFDGSGPGTIEIFQDLLIGPGLSSTLTFDYRAGWDIYYGSLARLFDVEIQPFGGGDSLFTPIITANPGTIVNDTTPLSETIDLSSFIGSNIRLSFISTIPENFTGPGQFQLDNVVLDVEPVPEPTTMILFGSGLIGLAGFRRRFKKL